LASVIRTFSLSTTVHDRLQRYLEGDQRARLSTYVTAIAAKRAPGVDVHGFKSEDYKTLREVLGVPAQVAFPPSNPAYFDSVVSTYLKPSSIQEFTAVYKRLRVANGVVGLGSRRASSLSSLVEALLILGMDSLEERAARSAENGEASTKTQGPSNSRRKSGDARKGKDKPTHAGARALTTA
jgi:hypothetical protein